MKKILFSCLILFSSITNASINISDNNTDVVNLRDNCAGVINCATTFEELLNWVWGTRQPSVNNPLLIDIGPGTFILQKSDGGYLKLCDGGSDVTFKGSGVDRTIISGSGGTLNLIPFVITDAVIKVKDCNNLTFQDMSIKTKPNDVALGGILGVGWIGGGNSVWNNVHIESDYWAWVDLCSATGIPGKHKWFGSSLESLGGGAVNSVYRSDCALNLIHGSEFLTVRRPNDNDLLEFFVAVEANTQNAQIQLYGTSVRAIYPSNGSGSTSYKTTSITGLKANDGGVIHMHGGIISVRSEHPGTFFNAIGAEVNNGGIIHTLETAYGMKASGAGIIKRLVNNNGSISSPFQWSSSNTPPLIESINGYDTFIEIDCDAAGDCSGNAPADSQHPHMMIYDNKCSLNGSWFDMVTNDCRK